MEHGTGKITIDNWKYRGQNGLDNFIKHMLSGKNKLIKAKKDKKNLSKFTPSGRIRLLVRN